MLKIKEFLSENFKKKDFIKKFEEVIKQLLINSEWGSPIFFENITDKAIEIGIIILYKKDNNKFHIFRKKINISEFKKIKVKDILDIPSTDLYYFVDILPKKFYFYDLKNKIVYIFQNISLSYDPFHKSANKKHKNKAKEILKNNLYAAFTLKDFEDLYKKIQTFIKK